MERVKVFKRSALTIVLTLMLVLSMVLGAAAQDAPQASTPKNLSTNFTLVNLEAGTNSGSINYYKPDGSQWKAAESFSFTARGDQVIKRQYQDAALPNGSGSVVVSASGKLGAVVQVTAQNQTATSGAYSGASVSSSSANIPLVQRKRTTASGPSSSQIVVQNAGTAATTADIKIIKADGTVQFTKAGVALAVGAAFNYDLADEADANIPTEFFGSAVVTAGSGGQIVVVSNLFIGSDSVQTFNAFITPGQSWLAPLVTSRLANNLSTPVAVQNLSTNAIPVGGAKLICKKDPTSASATGDFTASNATAIGPTASYFFNPVTDLTNLPTDWFGSCRIDTTGFDSVVFVQMRYVGGSNGNQAAAYEAIQATGTNKTVTFPLYAKRLANGFSTAMTIQNLSTSAAANVTLTYKKGDASLPDTCNLTKQASIPAGGSLIQNHRLTSGANSVPELSDTCFGTLVVTSSDQPIDGFAQLTDVSGKAGDTFMAHDGFATP
ncbi:hypothetical protein BH10CHL1_BH10CHL1_03280 [soil metagenome]